MGIVCYKKLDIMNLKCICFNLLLMVPAVLVSGQDIDLKIIATSLSIAEVPVRVPHSQFQFNKDRTPSGVSAKIIGGGVATAHDYPYQVALYLTIGGRRYFCGGTLVTASWVLTAAHCVEGATSVLGILGAHNLNVAEDSWVVFNSVTYIIHKSWDSDALQNDIALVRLPENITLNKHISTIPIAHGTDSYSGLMGRCLGWGLTILGEGIVGGCNGDSGGPLIINGTQVGVASFGAKNCSAGLPTVFTRLTEFYTWVNETIENFNKTNGVATKTGSPFSLCLGVVLSIVIANYLYTALQY